MLLQLTLLLHFMLMLPVIVAKHLKSGAFHFTYDTAFQHSCHFQIYTHTYTHTYMVPHITFTAIIFYMTVTLKYVHLCALCNVHRIEIITCIFLHCNRIACIITFYHAMRKCMAAAKVFVFLFLFDKTRTCHLSYLWFPCHHCCYYYYNFCLSCFDFDILSVHPYVSLKTFDNIEENFLFWHTYTLTYHSFLDYVAGLISLVSEPKNK